MNIKPLYFAGALSAAAFMLVAAAQAKTLSAQEFVQKASVANQFEISTSKLALEKSQNKDVKNFAQEMVDDHTKAGQELDDALAASKSGAKPATELDAPHQQKYDQLEKASGNDFNHKYIAIQTNAHKEAVSLFKDYAQHGEDAPLKDFASKTLPTLESHLKHVEKLGASE